MKEFYVKRCLDALHELNLIEDYGTVSVSGYSANANVIVNGMSMPLIAVSYTHLTLPTKA